MTPVLRHLMAILTLFTFEISAIQFGFVLGNANVPLINGRFVAFGTIPSDTSSKVQSEMRDFMSTYLDEELRTRSFEGINRQSFISHPQLMTAVKDGRSLIGLKGELSTFLKLLRFSCKKLTPSEGTWKNANFFSEPLVLLSFNEIGEFTKDLEVILIEVVFLEDDNDDIYAKMIKRDSSVTSTEEDSSSKSIRAEDKLCGTCIVT